MLVDKKTLVLTLPFIFFFLGYTISNLIIGNKTYQTPNLTGISIYEAIKLTSPHQINLRILSEKESADIPAGTILSQKPTAGRMIKTHQPIFVVTTKSPPHITAPSFIGQPLSTIEKTCTELHIKHKTYPLEWAAPRMSCIAQFPQAQEIIHDKKMSFYIAQDKQDTYLMPDFTNVPLNQVLECLKESQGKITVYHGSKKILPPYNQELRVSTQKPLAGSLLSLNNPCNIQLQVT